MRRFVLFFLLYGFATSSAVAGQMFAVATSPVVVLNRPDFAEVFGGRNGKTVLKDACGQIRAVEFIALPGTVFAVEKQINIKTGSIYRVTSDDYPYQSSGGFFVDARSVKIVPVRPSPRKPELPAKETILANLVKRNGTRYIWGGNVAAGVGELSLWYPPRGAVDTALWKLSGLDCSGLLYEATNGYTPRNTSSLINFGSMVSVKGKTAQEIAQLLEPLDLIVWPGHVLIALDGGKIIESRLDCNRPESGVRIRPSEETLADIMKSRKPVDRLNNRSTEFVVRRWHRDTGL
jgi:hypothetical protein